MTLAALSSAFTSGAPWDKGKLEVSENKRFIQHENGEPFFWLGDTAWLMLQRLDREQAARYFVNRKEKGFNVVQCIFLQNYSHQNVYGDFAYAPGEIENPIITPGNNPDNADEYDYWDHADYIVEKAAENGIYLAISLTWRDLLGNDENLTPETASRFASHMASRYKNSPNIIWVNGGSARGVNTIEIWDAIGTSLRKTDTDHIITFHPFGRSQSSDWFNDAPWLDLNMFVSGHRNYEGDNSDRKFGEDNWRYVLDDLSKSPLKPTLDGEPSYESLPEGLHDPMQPYWDAADVRRYAYWSVFAGACGHVYGQNTVRQVHFVGINKAESGAKLSFFEALDTPGSFQLQYLKNLVLSRPYGESVNDQATIVGDEGERYERILVSSGKAFLLAYTHTGRIFTLNLGRISGDAVKAWWFDPRTGAAHSIGEFPNAGEIRFDPPGTQYDGNDWVLVLDDVSKAFAAPGTI